MQIRLLDQPQDIRTAFAQKFVMQWPEYQAVYKEFIERCRIKQADFDRMLMWDRMRPDCPRASFRDALALLRGLPGEVQFLSEGPDYPYNYGCELHLEGQTYPHFVAVADARELADLIEFEWIEDARLFKEMCQLENQVLPHDLYICTPEMERLIVFTHETDDWDEDPIKAAESRVCFAFGFDRQK